MDTAKLISDGRERLEILLFCREIGQRLPSAGCLQQFGFEILVLRVQSVNFILQHGDLVAQLHSYGVRSLQLLLKLGNPSIRCDFRVLHGWQRCGSGGVSHVWWLVIGWERCGDSGDGRYFRWLVRRLGSIIVAVHEPNPWRDWLSLRHKSKNLLHALKERN